MKKILPDRVRSHADFDLTPLGTWAKSSATALTAVTQHSLYLYCLPKPFGPGCFDKVREDVAMHAPRRHTTRPVVPNVAPVSCRARLEFFGSGSAASSKAISETVTAQ